jgi:hypothetical protein
VNVITNTWTRKRRGATRKITVTIESTAGFGDTEWELLRAIDALANVYTDAPAEAPET